MRGKGDPYSMAKPCYYTTEQRNRPLINHTTIFNVAGD